MGFVFSSFVHHKIKGHVDYVKNKYEFHTAKNCFVMTQQRKSKKVFHTFDPISCLTKIRGLYYLLTSET